MKRSHSNAFLQRGRVKVERQEFEKALSARRAQQDMGWFLALDDAAILNAGFLGVTVPGPSFSSLEAFDRQLTLKRARHEGMAKSRSPTEMASPGQGVSDSESQGGEYYDTPAVTKRDGVQNNVNVKEKKGAGEDKNAKVQETSAAAEDESLNAKDQDTNEKAQKNGVGAKTKAPIKGPGSTVQSAGVDVSQKRDKSNSTSSKPSATQQLPVRRTRRRTSKAPKYTDSRSDSDEYVDEPPALKLA
ncbi:hypothetical protein BDZ89DRAFT_1139242 [Hymenopellis radicata]|nr:hypothetical protein BDZ89DRAFT_1139242 [Hymenopellis radicata]